MSIMLLSHETFRSIASTLDTYRYSTDDRLNRPCNIIDGYKSEEYIINMVKGLFIINFRSYELFYSPQKQSDEYVQALADKELDKWTIRKTKALDVYQMLKSCDCLLYNCYHELPNVEIDKHLMFLMDVINRLRCHIINHLPEYQAAKWK